MATRLVSLFVVLSLIFLLCYSLAATASVGKAQPLPNRAVAAQDATAPTAITADGAQTSCRLVAHMCADIYWRGQVLGK